MYFSIALSKLGRSFILSPVSRYAFYSSLFSSVVYLIGKISKKWNQKTEKLLGNKTLSSGSHSYTNLIFRAGTTNKTSIMALSRRQSVRFQKLSK